MRQCGDCQLCCKLLPVPPLGKPAGKRCKYQRVGKGCTVYPKRPHACRVFSCLWLEQDDTDALSRPDRAHYVIDPMLDFITAKPESGEPIQYLVVQIWVDPAFPDAHKDPSLRAFLARRGELQGMAAIIRFSERNGFVLFPPALTGADWQIAGIDAAILTEKQHTPAEIAAVMAQYQGKAEGD